MVNDSSVTTKALFEIDSYIDQLVKKIELLSYVNPLNIEKEKQGTDTSRAVQKVEILILSSS